MGYKDPLFGNLDGGKIVKAIGIGYIGYIVFILIVAGAAYFAAHAGILKL